MTNRRNRSLRAIFIAFCLTLVFIIGAVFSYASATELKDNQFKLSQTQYEYVGSQIKPGFSTALKRSTDFTVSYGDNKNVGTGTVTFTGKGKYTGTVTKKFKIIKAHNKITRFNVEDGQVGDSKLYSWDIKAMFGAAHTVVYFSKSANGNYTTTEPDSAGTYYAKAYIPGTSNYEEIWSKPVRFTIRPASITTPKGNVTILNTIANSANRTNDVIWDKSKVTGATNYEINWRARGASRWVSARVGNTVRGVTTGLSIGQLYEIRVRPANIRYGNKAYGAWSPTVYRYFHTTQRIRLKSESKGSFTMSWAGNPSATSYQVMFTTNKNGAGAAKNINTVGASATSFTKSGLRSGGTYYVQVREIKKVGNISYIGNISCPVAVKVK